MGMRSTVPLVGRDAELERAWVGLTAPEDGIVALAGEPGVGKTAVFDALVRRLRHDHVVACAYAVEAEADLSYAAFADLANPLYDLAGRELPAAQRGPLDSALLRGEGQGVDLRAVATAFLTLIRTVAAEQPLTLAIDDVQWVDPASAAAIGYAVRRLDGERCSVLASVRSGQAAHLLERLGDAVVTTPLAGLTPADTRALLAAALGEPCSAITAARIHALSEGNPLLSLELARAQVVDGDPAGMPALSALSERLEKLHAARIGALRPGTRRVALHVAAHGRPSRAELARALPSSSTGARLADAVSAGVLMANGDVRFTHPLLGAAAYAAATDAERRRAHRAWAAVVDGAEEHARHLAKSSAGRNERAAAACERGATEAQRRGSVLAAAELAALSLRLTPARRTADRGRRGRMAIEMIYAAGDLPEARRLVDQLAEEAVDPGERSRLLSLQGRILIFERDRDERAATLVQALATSQNDPRAAAEAHIELALLNMSGPGANVRHAQMAVRIAEGLPGEEGLLARALLELFNARCVHEAEIDLPLIDRAEALERRVGGIPMFDSTAIVRALAVTDMGRYDDSVRALHVLVTDCEQRGEVIVLPELHLNLSCTYWFAGRLDRARLHAERAWQLGNELGQLYTGALAQLVTLCAVADGDAYDAALPELEKTATVLSGRPASWSYAPARVALGHLAMLRGRWDDSAGHFDAAADSCASRGINSWSFQFEGDHVEALLAAGRREDAWRRMDRLVMQAARPHGVWPAMAAHRCRALMFAAEGRTTEARTEVQEARAAAETLSPLDVGRCLLVEGSVERRAKQKRAARQAFAAARETFTAIGAGTWAERAAQEASRVGGRAPSDDELTTTERRVVDLAAHGLRNREIAAALFISEHTVESNLTRAFRKLGVRSRTQLSRSVAAGS